mmetsp:Transcript_2219/g.14729  ORF Transcript_2219/g.14729 Transcript_2219/m.14729 type:complete len:131 (-) Transcript_2219:1352-1744(-)
MLSAKQECLVKLFCIADAKKWKMLPECAENALQAGATPGELRSTLRQLVMCVYSKPIPTQQFQAYALTLLKNERVQVCRVRTRSESIPCAEGSRKASRVVSWQSGWSPRRCLEESLQEPCRSCAANHARG